jgi:serine/threonine-protein kinase RsbW
MTNVEQPQLLDDAARTRTRRGHRSGHVLIAERFQAADLRRLRDRCRAALRDTGLDDDRTSMFVTAINECLTNAIRHGGGHGGFVLIDDGALLVAEIIDQGPGVSAAMPEQLPAVDAVDGRGLWIVQRMVDRVTLTTGTTGTILRLEMAHTLTTGITPATRDTTPRLERPAKGEHKGREVGAG